MGGTSGLGPSDLGTWGLGGMGPFRVNWGGKFSSSHFIFIGQMDALLQGGTMLWTSHLGLIGGGKCSTYHWKILVEWYSRKHVKKVYWGTDIVWTSHLGLIGGEGSTYHWKILVEWYSLKHVKKVYWGTDIVWTSHSESTDSICILMLRGWASQNGFIWR